MVVYRETEARTTLGYRLVAQLLSESCSIPPHPRVIQPTMPVESVLERIRNGIRTVMAQWSRHAGEIEQETILIQNGHYCGRRFRSSELEAVWFLEEEQLKLYHRDGSLLEVYSINQIMKLSRDAAA